MHRVSAVRGRHHERTLFKNYADNHFMTVYGEPTQELIDLVKAHHMENQFKWFSFIKGLDSSSQ